MSKEHWRVVLISLVVVVVVMIAAAKVPFVSKLTSGQNPLSK